MKRGCPANVGSPVFFPAGTRPATPDRHPAPGERDHGVVDSRAAGEGEDREHDLVRSHLGALQHLLHELELGRVVGREEDLHRHAREAIRLRHLDVSLAAEASPAGWLNSTSYWRQTKELRKTKRWLRLTCVSVQVKLAEPVRSAGLPGFVALPSK